MKPPVAQLGGKTKGIEVLNSGYFYAPYVPMMRTPIWIPGLDEVYGASSEMVHNLARELWEKAEEPKKDSLYYWNEALLELVHPLALGVADEAGVIFKPGTLTWPYCFHKHEYERFAQGRIEGTKLVLQGSFGWREFDLNVDGSVDDIIRVLKWFKETVTGYGGSPDEYIVMTAGGCKAKIAGRTHFGRNILRIFIASPQSHCFDRNPVPQNSESVARDKSSLSACCNVILVFFMVIPLILNHFYLLWR